MGIKTITHFGEPPEHITSEEHKYIQGARKFLNFYERILYKWQNTMTIEEHSSKYVMYFTNHKKWGFVEHERCKLSTPAIEGILGIKFFSVFQSIFANKQFDWKNILLERPANLAADYAVHLFETMDCTNAWHGVKWEILAKYHFWQQHKKRFKFEMARDLVDMRRCPVETTLSDLFTCILPVDMILKTELNPNVKVAYYGETVQEYNDNKTPFYWPPLTNFEAKEITQFNTYKLLHHLPPSVRKFFTELSRQLDSCMQINGSFRKVEGDPSKYKFCLTLSIVDWEWLISCSQVPGVDVTQNSKAVLNNTETSMLMGLLENLSKRLLFHDEMIENIKKGVASNIGAVKIIVRLLYELRYYKSKSEKPWELPQWKNAAAKFWEKERNQQKVVKYEDVGDTTVKSSNDNGEPSKKKARSSRKQCPDGDQTKSEIAPQESKVSPKTRKMLKNGKIIVKRRRGTFSFPCRGYVPPIPKELRTNVTFREKAEKTTGYAATRF